MQDYTQLCVTLHKIFMFLFYLYVVSIFRKMCVLSVVIKIRKQLIIKIESFKGYRTQNVLQVCQNLKNLI